MIERRELLAGFLGYSALGLGCRPPRAAVAPAPIDARWERVRHAFESSLEAHLAPGGAVAVVVDGRPAFSAARGVKRIGTNDLVSTGTLFRVESVTKSFTALAASKLVEKGALDLDAPIGEIVREVRFTDEAKAQSVTLRRLLLHTAGLPHNADLKLRDVRAGSEYSDLFAKNPLVVGTVDRFEYSNVGYLLVGAAVERAAKLPISDALRTLVTMPLGLQMATCDSGIAMARDHADGFGLDWDNHERSFDPASLDPYVQRPVGGLHASIDELAFFAARYLAGASEVVRAETFAEITKPRTPTNEPKVSYGYGLYVVDSSHGPVWTHTGGGHGSTAQFLCVPRERFALVALTNAGRYGGWRDVRRAAEEAYFGAALF